MTKRLAIFDCDGTLVDGQHEVCAAMESAFAEHDLSAPPRSEIRRIVGLSLPNALRRVAPDVPDESVASLVEAYKQAFFSARQRGEIHEPLFDGIRELLVDLLQDGWQLAVATGKSERGLKACLATHQLSDLFVSLQSADHHPSKPHPAMLEAALADTGADAENSVMIGDTSFDMEMARAANIRAVGVAWGYHSVAELRQFGAEVVAQTPAELKDILE